MDTLSRPTVIVSNCLQTLLQSLKQRVQACLNDPFYTIEIVVSDASVKTILQLELAKVSGILFGVEVITIQEYAKRASGVGLVDLYIAACSMQLKAAQSAAMTSELALDIWYGNPIPRGSQKQHYLQIRDGLVKNSKRNTKALREVFVFAVSAICPFLINVLKQHPKVTYYVLSPCMHFWGDVCSDREAKKLTRKTPAKLSNALAGYLYDRSKLLANNGIMAREFIGYLQEETDEFQELYCVKKWQTLDESYGQYIRQEAVYKIEEEKPKLLDIIHADLLLMKEHGGSLVDFSANDSSVEVHKAPTLYREVEVLYQYIQKILPETRGPIVVFAPDIEQYKPYIQSLFTQGYEIIGAKKCEAIDAFFEILCIPYKRLTSKKIYELFGIASIRNKCGIELEDLPILAACLDVFDSNKEDFDEQIIITWIAALEKKLEFSSTDAEAIGKCLDVLQNLRVDIYTFHAKKIRPLQEWLRLFLEILEKYFEPTYDEKDDYFVLKEALIAAFKSPQAVLFKSCDHETALSIFSVALDELEEQKEALCLSKIIFANLGDARTLAKDVVCFLGMNDAAFPRSSATSLRKFGFLHSGKAPYSISAIDRHLFIEAILSTSCKLYISCQSFAFKERSAIEAAAIVQEILDTLDTLCTIKGEIPSKVIVQEHGLESCVDGLFDRQSIVSNTRLEEIVCPKVNAITINELNQVAKSPLKAYMQQGLGLYLREYKPPVRSSEFEVLNPRSIGGLKKQAFTLGKQESYALIAGQLHALPKAVHDAAIDLVVHDLGELQEKANTLGIKSDEPYEIELSLTARAVQKVDEKRWKIPAIILTVDSEPIAITGTFTNLYKQGVVLQDKKSKAGLFAAWPTILLAHVLAEFIPLEISLGLHVFFIKDAKSICIHIEEPKKRLIEYVAYALECRKTPSCLYPDWVEALILHEGLSEKLITSSEHKKLDPYLELYIARQGKDAIQQLWPEFQKKAIQLFGGIDEV